MLTRVEIDGFKSFEGFSLDLQPFTVIFGVNATGKSNLFDALRLLSRLASMDLPSAFAGSESGREGEVPRGDPIEQFRKTSAGASHRITIAVEVLLPRQVRDTHGGEGKIAQTRLRYRLAIERREEQGRERLVVASEEALPIRKDGDRWQPGGGESSRAFEGAFVARGRKSPFISTQEENGRTLLHLHQEGRQGRKRPADNVSATVLSSITTIDFPHLYALKEELRAIHFLHLDPVALRSPSPIMAPDLLMPDGRNLASVLARVEQETRNDTHHRGALTDIRNTLSTLVPGILDVHVRYDETERRHRVELETSDGLTLSARVASDGTLRMLALTGMIHDPRCPSVICFEEPENGIHRTRLVGLVEMLRCACTDPSREDVEPDEPLRQILLNTHSPVVAKALIAHKHDIVVAQTVRRVSDGRSERLTLMRTHQTSRQGSLPVTEGPRPLSDYEIEELAGANDAFAA